jgi:TetR/AcrR family transcriptional regulator, transcriptional repressor for nem operon
MGRAKEFDPEVALERAMNVFWLKGYQNASVGELLTAMQINRWSLYETFGDKQELFLQALQLYRRRWGQMIAEHLAVPGSPKAALVRLLRAMGRELVSDTLGRGCLVANSAVELRYLDDEAQRVVRGSLDTLEGAFTRVLEGAAAAGELASPLPPRKLAAFLIAAMNGIRDVAKMDRDPKRIHELVESLLSIL